MKGKNLWLWVFLVGAFALGIFLSVYKLTESPPPWHDEGIFTQVAKNVAEQGVYKVELAPGNFVSAGFVTTGYPVILPVALSFKLFGTGLLQARLVMAVFILILFIFAYLFFKKETNKFYALLSLLLLVSFAPIYGHGRNVIGEVPGTALIFILLFIFKFLESKENISVGFSFLAGLAAGLTMATKPIFLIFLAPTFVITFLFFRPNNFSWKFIGAFILTAVAPVALWFFLHFGGDSLSEILSIYSGNPDRINIFSVIFGNIKNLLTHIETLYFLGLMAVWLVGLWLTRKEGGAISFAEKNALIFSALLFLGYLGSVGYYRYFFPAEVLALAFLPLSLSRLSFYLFPKLKINVVYINRVVCVVVAGLFIFQLYQTGFKSFVAGYFGSNHTAVLSQYLGSLPADKSLFVYNVPEAVLFLPHNNYYQYAKFAKAERGRENLALIAQKIPDEIIIHSGEWGSLPDIYANYDFKTELGGYDILTRKR